MHGVAFVQSSIYVCLKKHTVLYVINHGFTFCSLTEQKFRKKCEKTII